MLFRVVKCYKCDTYQVDSVKKAKKWDCRMCGEKQSVQVEYSTGTAKDCRHQVQQLNMEKAAIEAKRDEVAEKVLRGEIQFPQNADKSPGKCTVKSSSKWAAVESEGSDEENDQSGGIFSNPFASGQNSWKDLWKERKKQDFKELSAKESVSGTSKSAVEEDLGKNSIFSKDEKPKAPSWKNLYGTKRKTEKKDFQSNPRTYTGSSSSGYFQGRNMPLPKLLDSTKLIKGQQYTKKTNNISAFVPASKKFREE